MSKTSEAKGICIQITSKNTTEQETEMKTEGVAATSRAASDGGEQSNPSTPLHKSDPFPFLEDLGRDEGLLKAKSRRIKTVSGVSHDLPTHYLPRWE
uniref:Uncharacterized protein n=1 Tax=Cucumis melo TaxID=3656 RepID=A0A9I9DQK1_CUCME